MSIRENWIQYCRVIGRYYGNLNPLVYHGSSFTTVVYSCGPLWAALHNIAGNDNRSTR